MKMMIVQCLLYFEDSRDSYKYRVVNFAEWILFLIFTSFDLETLINLLFLDIS